MPEQGCGAATSFACSLSREGHRGVGRRQAWEQTPSSHHRHLFTHQLEAAQFPDGWSRPSLAGTTGTRALHRPVAGEAQPEWGRAVGRGGWGSARSHRLPPGGERLAPAPGTARQPLSAVGPQQAAALRGWEPQRPSPPGRPVRQAVTVWGPWGERQVCPLLPYCLSVPSLQRARVRHSP